MMREEYWRRNLARADADMAAFCAPRYRLRDALTNEEAFAHWSAIARRLRRFAGEAVLIAACSCMALFTLASIFLLIGGFAR